MWPSKAWIILQELFHFRFDGQFGWVYLESMGIFSLHDFWNMIGWRRKLTLIDSKLKRNQLCYFNLQMQIASHSKYLCNNSTWFWCHWVWGCCCKPVPHPPFPHRMLGQVEVARATFRHVWHNALVGYNGPRCEAEWLPCRDRAFDRLYEEHLYADLLPSRTGHGFHDSFSGKKARLDTIVSFLIARYVHRYHFFSLKDNILGLRNEKQSAYRPPLRPWTPPGPENCTVRNSWGGGEKM